MIFTSFEFLLFFALVLSARALCTSLNAEKWVLMFASYAFYASWNVAYVGLLFGVSSVDYFIGRQLGRMENDAARKSFVSLSVCMNLGLLAFFKYSNWAAENFSGLLRAFGWNVHPMHLDVILPLGLSFFTFQSMSYILDVYRREIQPCSRMRDFLLFVSFFPQLIAGPIVRAADFLPQLLSRRRATATEIESGVAQFLLGAIKKGVLSDQVSAHVDVIFANPAAFDAPSLLLAVLGYALQIYCDFSGYSDMAIGTARILGFKFMENFRMPYSSLNITEFWRRWHISLSTWLRDYLYIPLGGNRRGTGRTYFNLFLTMFLGGLWHGAGWNFLFWGMLHGVALAVHRFWKTTALGQAAVTSPALRFFGRGASWLLTLSVVLLGWVFFRAQNFSVALDFLRGLVGGNVHPQRMFSPQVGLAVAAVAAVHLALRKDSDWCLEIVYRRPWVRVAAYTGLLSLLINLGATHASPFIYFQF